MFAYLIGGLLTLGLVVVPVLWLTGISIPWWIIALELVYGVIAWNTYPGFRGLIRENQQSTTPNTVPPLQDIVFSEGQVIEDWIESIRYGEKNGNLIAVIMHEKDAERWEVRLWPDFETDRFFAKLNEAEAFVLSEFGPGS